MHLLQLFESTCWWSERCCVVHAILAAFQQQVEAGITDMTWQLSVIATTLKDEKWWELFVHTSYCKREGQTRLGDTRRCRYDWSVEIIEIYLKGWTRCNRVTFEIRWSEHGHPATWHWRPHQASQLLVAPDAVLKCSSYVIFIPKAFRGHCRGLWWKEEGGLHGNSVWAPNRFHMLRDEDQPKDEFLRLKQRVWTLKIWRCRRWQIIANHSNG